MLFAVGRRIDSEGHQLSQYILKINFWNIKKIAEVQTEKGFANKITCHNAREMFSGWLVTVMNMG